MPNVHQSPAAESDLTDIWFHIAVDNLPAAGRFLAMILEKCELIASHPRMGVARPDLGDHIRIHVIDDYIVCYRPVQDGIELVRVLHGARDLPDQFNESP